MAGRRYSSTTADLFAPLAMPEGAAGVDEAGRGPLAGPVVAAAVILDPDRPIPGLADSKTLTPARRTMLAEAIRTRALAYAVCAIEAAEIDALNILRASLKAMQLSVQALPRTPVEAWVDGNQRPPALGIPIRTVVGGDALLPAISAASILAKTHRDSLLVALAQRHPGYGFEHHFGYPTAAHLRALDQLGPCVEHRRSFAPVARCIQSRTGG